MTRKKSQTQYCFNVGLRPQSELRGVALLGHQTLARLHESISGARGFSSEISFSFRFGGSEIQHTTSLDDLNLKVGQTLEYTVYSIDDNRHETIVVDFIDNE